MLHTPTRRLPVSKLPTRKPTPKPPASRRKRILIIGAAVLTLTATALAVGSLWGPSERTLATGQALFEHQWQPHDPLAGEGDGLGPVFNATSCVACHFQGGVGGAGPTQHNVLAFDVHPTPAHPEVHAGVVHAAATHPNLLEARSYVQELFPIVKGGTRVVKGCRIQLQDFNPVRFTHINTPALFGGGLLDGLSDARIMLTAQWRSVGLVAQELNLDFSGTPPGRPRLLPDGRLGRFGWKAQFATLEEFVAAACAVEIGLTNPLRQQDLPQQHRPDPDAAWDLDGRQFYELVSFVENLPRPQQRLPDDPHQLELVRRGEELFSSIGCTDCHPRELAGIEGLYSDLMLHRVEDPDRLAAEYGGSRTPEVPLPAHEPLPDEWKTPPLWGVADSAPYFHDGGSATLLDAVTRHHGQAAGVTKRFQALQADEQSAVIAFLETLRVPRIEASLSPGLSALAANETP